MEESTRLLKQISPNFMYRYDYRKTINQKPSDILKEASGAVQNVQTVGGTR